VTVRPKSQATKEYKTSLGKLTRLIITASLIIAATLLAFFLFVRFQSWREQRAVVQQNRQTQVAEAQEARNEARAATQAAVQKERELFSSPWILYSTDSKTETSIWITHRPGSDELEYTYSFTRRGATHVVEGSCEEVDVNRFECRWKQQTSSNQSSRGKLTLIRQSERLFSGFETYVGSDPANTGVTPIYVAASPQDIPR